jgi:hypothetical protein
METEYSKQFGRVQESDLPKHERRKGKKKKKKEAPPGIKIKLGDILKEALKK